MGGQVKVPPSAKDAEGAGHRDMSCIWKPKVKVPTLVAKNATKDGAPSTIQMNGQEDARRPTVRQCLKFPPYENRVGRGTHALRSVIRKELPLAGFYQLADFALDQVTLQRADVADVELPI
jgi:hypothetical protein